MAHLLPNELTCSKGMLYCFWLWADTVTMGLWSILVLLGFCSAIFIATIRFGTPRAFGFASFVGMMGGIWFATMQFLSWWIASIFILAGIIGIGMMVLSEKM